MPDNIMIAHEMMHSVKHRKMDDDFAAVMKIDLNKAYDRIQWDLISKVLKSLQFPDCGVTWILECIYSTSLSVLINGEPSECFRPFVGLRQGYSLFPYMFILCIEVLSRQLTSFQDHGLLIRWFTHGKKGSDS